MLKKIPNKRASKGKVNFMKKFSALLIKNQVKLTQESEPVKEEDKK